MKPLSVEMACFLVIQNEIQAVCLVFNNKALVEFQSFKLYKKNNKKALLKRQNRKVIEKQRN